MENKERGEGRVMRVQMMQGDRTNADEYEVTIDGVRRLTGVVADWRLWITNGKVAMGLRNWEELESAPR